MESKPPFASWAVVELMGHQQIAGYVTEEPIAGTPMLRVDVPETASSRPFTKFFGASAIYGITPTTEAIATSQAQTLDVQPFNTWLGGRITFSVSGIEITNSQRSALLGSQESDEASWHDGMSVKDEDDEDEEEEGESAPEF